MSSYWCCKAREKFLLGIQAVNKTVPDEEVLDHVTDFKRPGDGKIQIQISYCPFCGTKIDGNQLLRVVH